VSDASVDLDAIKIYRTAVTVSRPARVSVRPDVNLVREADEDPVFDDPGRRRQRRRQRVRVGDLAERAVEHEVPVVRDDRPVLSLRAPQGRLAAGRSHRLGDGGAAGGGAPQPERTD